MYALTFSETYHEDDPGCTEDHEHNWCEQPSGHVNVTVGSLHRERRDLGGHFEVKPGSYNLSYECEDVPIGSTAYLVIVEYTDGGTFGYDGYWTVAGLYATPEAAEACRAKCNGENDTARTYRPWDGYFASLGETRVEPMVVQA